MEVKQKSIKLNMLLNVIKNALTVIFPLISFPYVSSVLGVESLGRYNFATSVISYILLLAGLGIESYAIREGSKFRDDKAKLSKFANQVFSINIVSSLFAYVVLGILIICVSKFESYTSLLLILSAQVLFTTLGVNWIYSIYEEYAYITIRSIIVQICSIVLMFIFVKSPEDVQIYAIITVVASVGSNIFNFFFSRKFCKIKFVFKMDLKKHIKPIMLLFAMAATVTIYVSSDNIILGFISGEYAVGIYSVSVKIYNLVKTLLASALIVSIPRISMLFGQKRNNDAEEVANSVYSILITMVFPGVTGLIMLGREVILLLSDEAYVSAYTSHVILSLAMIFTLGAYFWGTAVLVSLKKENITLIATVISAVLNITLNFVLIPLYEEVAAAFTTLLAELFAFIWCYVHGRKYVKINGFFKLLVKVLLGCVPICAIAIGLKYVINNLIIYVCLTVILSCLAYLIIEILLKNESITSIINAIKNKFKRRTL